MTEMFPRPTDHLQPQKQSAWLEKAKQTIQIGEKKLEPFSFQPAVSVVVCISLQELTSCPVLCQIEQHRGFKEAPGQDV